MIKINIEEAVKRMKKGESIKDIAKSYNVHKYFLIAAIHESITNEDKNNKTHSYDIWFDMIQYFNQFREFIIKYGEVSKTGLEAFGRAFKEYGLNREEYIELIEEYHEIKAKGDIDINYNKHSKDIELISKNTLELYKLTIKFAESLKIELEELEDRFKVFFEYMKIDKKISVARKVKLGLLQDRVLKDILRELQEKENIFISYSSFMKDINLMGYKINDKVNKMYHPLNTLTVELTRFNNRVVLLDELDEIMFKREMESASDIDKELSIIAAEKNLSLKEYKDYILAKYLDSNFKVRT